MSFQRREDLKVVETLKEVSHRYRSECIFDIDPDKNPEKWAENHRILDALEFAQSYLKDAFREKKFDAVMVNGNLAPADTEGYADELAGDAKHRLLDVTCPVCGSVSRAVDRNDLRNTVFCWKCGQPMRANYDAMSTALRQRSHAQKGAGNE